jgi:RimJ/RimL family protein N-acetyltransferase
MTMTPGLDYTFENQYPLTRTIKDRGEITLRPVVESDEDALLAFYRSLPEETRLRLKQDNTNRAILKRFLENISLGTVITLGAFGPDGKTVVAEITLRVQHHGWLRHVGEVRYCVVPEYSDTVLPETLLMQMVEIAATLGLDKIAYLVLDDQVRLRALLERLGFKAEAELANHATDLHGKKHTVIIMSNLIAELWRQMEDMILLQEDRSYV